MYSCFKDMKTILKLHDLVPRIPELRFRKPINWEIKEGEQWAIIGPNGAGKTLLADLMQKKLALREGEIIFHEDENISEKIKSIAFKDIHSFADSKTTYYQQRWHSTETDGVPTVRELLDKNQNDEVIDGLFKYFNIGEMLDKLVIYLSSGELRKFLIFRILLTRPRILILDNPFIGLDASSRGILNELLKQMSELNGLHVVLLLSNPQDIPDMITDVLPICNCECGNPVKREEFLSDTVLMRKLFPVSFRDIGLPIQVSRVSEHNVTFRMEKVNIKYGKRIILKELDWEVKNGEKWALLGPNGAGKSTLLSLIYADNPQSYANTLYLFDRKRGTGESIWEIKKRIGYVSPEMHLYYMENVPAVQIVRSGFFDSVGLYRKCSSEQERIAMNWMEVFGILHLHERSFLSLSSGEQRLVLLARAFVKDPDLLILDEPLHGLDIANKKKAGFVIEKFCNRPGKTLIYVTHYPDEMPSCIDHRFNLKKNC